MSSRLLLWIALSAAGLPFLIETTTGCSLIVDTSTLADDNAYICECACDVGAPIPVTSEVQTGADDASEVVATGSVDTGSEILELAVGSLVGVRFDGLGIPPGATIKEASVQFKADLDGMDPTTVTIRIEEAGDAPPFSNTDDDISSRPTLGDVEWVVPEWMQSGNGPDQETENVAELIQLVVNRPDWDETSAVVLIFETTTGERIAESFEDGDVPFLRIEFSSTIATRLPVCEDNEDDAGDKARMRADCEGRVTNTFNQLSETCLGVENAASSCSCSLVPTSFDDENDDDVPDEGEKKDYAFEHAVCDNECPGVELDPLCENFDPVGFNECLDFELTNCENQDPKPNPCVISEACLAKVSATQTTGSPVCIAADGPGDAQPMAMHLGGQQSICEVSGISEILVGDGQDEPKKDPRTVGSLAILGGPCPGSTCPAGFSAQLAMESISFDVKFAPDPKFDDLFQAGGAPPGAAVVGGATAGSVPEGAAFAVSTGRRGNDERAVSTGNSEPLALTVNWSAQFCRLEGSLAGSVDAEGIEGGCVEDAAIACFIDADCDGVGGGCDLPEDPEPLVVNLDLFGFLTEQPPTARAGDSQTVECTSTAGATFVLDGSSSSDPDDAPGLFPDIRMASWRLGDRLGEEIGSELQVATSLGVGEAGTYLLRVIDSALRSDEDTTTIAVIDTTKPDVFCNAPDTITPEQVPDKHSEKPPVAFTATASDLCDAAVVPEILGFDCFAIKRNGRIVDKTQSCEVELSGDTLTVLDPGGVGDHIAWTVLATDASGNARQLECELEVVRKM
jgi:hypothetical protein